jgi:hypothetical protein
MQYTRISKRLLLYGLYSWKRDAIHFQRRRAVGFLSINLGRHEQAAFITNSFRQNRPNRVQCAALQTTKYRRFPAASAEASLEVAPSAGRKTQ